MYVTQALHRTVQQQPDVVATIFGDRRTTFAEQRDRVSRVAGGLREVGVRPGDRVGFLGLNSDRFYEYYFAVPWADAVLNPVNTRWAVAEIIYALEDSQTTALMVDDVFLPLVEQICAHYGGLEILIYVGEGAVPDGMQAYEELASTGPPMPDARRCGDDMAGLFYTGGTTGFPKGVVLSHRNLLTSVLGMQAAGVFPRTSGLTLHVAPMFHLAAVSELLSCAVAARGQIILPAFDPLAVLEAVDKERVEALRLIPVMLQMLIDHPRFDDFDLSCVSSIGYGGSPIAPAVLQRATAKFPGADFVQVFGQTELSPVTSLLGAEDHSPDTLLTRSAGARRRTPRSGSWTTVMPNCRRGRLARSWCAADMSCSATGESRPRPPRRCEAVGCTPVTQAISMHRAICSSLIGSRMSSSPAERTCSPPRWRASSRPTPAWRRVQ
jgi:acyl-CoA synthetase (AMP-forming)/AMP-acid ligase II